MGPEGGTDHLPVSIGSTLNNSLRQFVMKVNIDAVGQPQPDSDAT